MTTPSDLLSDTLTRLKQDRFAIDKLPKDQYAQLYRLILDQFQIEMGQTSDWFLIGTEECHLCQLAQTTLLLAQKNHPSIRYHKLDLADAESLVDLMGWHIPLLLTPKRLLGYPFGIMDLIGLADQEREIDNMVNEN